jgi:gluconolactonase
MRTRDLVSVSSLVLLAAACGEEPPPAGGSGGQAGVMSGGGAGTNSSGRSGSAGASGASAGSAQGGSSAAGASGANAGSAGSAGSSPVGGAGGAGGLAGAAGSGGTLAGSGGDAPTAGDAGMAGSAMAGSAGATGGAAGGGGGGAGGGAGSGGAAGTGGGKNLHGGASAAFVCPAGPFGEPLQGMGSVTSIGPPTMGQPNYFAFIEGPIWIGSLGKLFFSDNVSPERIWQVTPGGMPSVFLENSGSNGLALDGDDKLLVADQAGRRITRLDPTSMSPMAAVVVADAGCKPNDLVLRSDGNLYYTAPNESGSGFYRVDPQGMRTGPRTEVNAPNGIVLSPDENTLYVGDVGNRSITAFSLAADGSIGATAMPFATATNQIVDGMCVDCAGNVYASTQNGVEVFSPTGMPIGTVPTGEASNCTFGGADRQTLFTTSRNVIKTVTLNVPGLPD